MRNLRQQNLKIAPQLSQNVGILIAMTIIMMCLLDLPSSPHLISSGPKTQILYPKHATAVPQLQVLLDCSLQQQQEPQKIPVVLVATGKGCRAVS